MGVPIRPSWRAPSYMAFALTLGAGERLHAHCLYHWALVPRRSLSLFRMQVRRGWAPPRAPAPKCAHPDVCSPP